jgi:hypothetical protein
MLLAGCRKLVEHREAIRATIAAMETAAKKKSSLALGVIASMIAWVAACLVSSAAMASSVAPNRLDTPASSIGAGLPTTAPSIEPTAPTTPPNTLLEWSKTRAEVSGGFTLTTIEPIAVTATSATRYYDCLGEVALECTVAPNSAGKYLADNWHQGTFPNRMQSVRYHLAKHGKGRTAQQYTQDAMDFFHKNQHLGQKVTLKDGTPGIKIQTKVMIPGLKTQRIGGYWTQDGKLVTFWD